MNKLSAVIITYNEEANITAALDSLSFADEVIIVDSGSTDRTCEIAESRNARVFRYKFEGYASQKNRAIDQCSYDWVLIMDADERIPLALRKEIRSILSNPGNSRAFSIGRVNYFMGMKVRFSGWRGDRVTRLVHRKYARYYDSAVHEEMQVNGKVSKLKHKMDHYTYRDLESYLNKSWNYATLGAHDRYTRHGKVTAYHLLIKPIWGFMNKYFFKLGFLDGKVGLVIALQHFSYLFNRALKLWRLQEGENIQAK
jgi:glycosyltransferase involved in cell wall biosynthesis